MRIRAWGTGCSESNRVIELRDRFSFSFLFFFLFWRRKSGSGKTGLAVGHFLKQGVFSSRVVTPANLLGKARPGQTTPLGCDVVRTLVRGGFACVPCQLRRPLPFPMRALARKGSNAPCPLAKRRGRQARNFCVLCSDVRLQLHRPEARGLGGEASHHFTLNPSRRPPQTPRQSTFRLSHDARARARQGLGEGG